uniref:B30.2/SPRY domain-containing protein n=1 Tax=Meloidogyne incognita TaxID=6306 RepID=A0A914MQK3_MELIC
MKEKILNKINLNDNRKWQKRFKFKVEDYNNVKEENENKQILNNLLNDKGDEGNEELWLWDNNINLINSNVVQFKNNGYSILFHPEYSVGTAAIRSKISLNRNSLAFWEIYVENIFGSSMMFGIGTENSLLTATLVFANLLGDFCNENFNEFESYGLSHKGIFYHGGISYKFCEPFPENLPCRVGIIFDGIKQKIGYFLNGNWLGWAPIKLEFFDKKQQKQRLFYPMYRPTFIIYNFKWFN